MVTKELFLSIWYTERSLGLNIVTHIEPIAVMVTYRKYHFNICLRKHGFVTLVSYNILHSQQAREQEQCIVKSCKFVRIVLSGSF